MSYGCSDGKSAIVPLAPDTDVSEPSWRAMGDFYCEPDNVTRGLTMCPADVHQASFGGFDLNGEAAGFIKGFAGPGVGKATDYFSDTLSGEILHGVIAKRDCFVETDSPPSLPADTFFKLEHTSFFTSGEPAFVIGNHLLDFLYNDVVSSIKNLDKRKYCTNADVFVNNDMCSLEIHVYAHDSKRFAIEFQKLSGDAFTFYNAYQKAFHHLKLRGTNVEGGPEPSLKAAFGVPPELPEGLPAVIDSDLTPLFDMAALVSNPPLQAEAASSLASMAQDAATISLLCSNGTFDAILKLLLTDALEVAYPTSRVLSHLAQRDEATKFFSLGMLTTIIEKVRKSSSMLVQEELAKALNHAMQRQALQDKQAAMLEPALSAAIAEKGMSNVAIAENLQAAQLSLNCPISPSHGP
mmetsp:Transcript_33055/g.58786  ORF Transcript_33055/g.58786 Transcript_33055/m.58786 type:complete len:409 (+) Transcript_33055:86-1312(+)